MWLKLSGRAVLTRRISNAGINFIQVLNKLSGPGRYFPPFDMFSAIDLNTVFRIVHQTVMLKPYAATIHHPLLQFVYFRSTLSAF